MAEPTNSEIAAALDELGDLSELDGAIIHRIVAYRNAAKAVRDAPVSVTALARQGRATELPGIGAVIQEKVLALADDGVIPATAKLRAKFPPGLLEITRLPGLGPKRARRLYEELSIDSLQSLIAAAEAQQIRTLKGFGPKAEESILAAATAAVAAAADPANGDGSRRIVLNRALAVGEQLVATLREHPASERVELAGSARRMTDSVKDLDVIATARDPLALAQAAAALELVESAQTPGDAGVRLRTHTGLKVDLRIVEPDQFGNLMQHFTGSKEHNMALRDAAVRKGLHVSEYGVLDDATGETHRCEREERGLRAARPGVHRARAAREPRRARGGGRRHAAGADRARRPAGRPALPHDRLGRDRVDRGDGARRARGRLRVPRDHRPLGELRVRRRGLAGPAARADRADPRAVEDRRRRRARAAGRLGGQHPRPTARSTTTTSCWPSSTGSWRRSTRRSRWTRPR